MSKLPQTFSTRRIEALSDSIFAFAMTLLVVDLVAPHLGAGTNKALADALKEALPLLLTFVISFLLLGSMWSVHARQFEFIKRADRRLVFINNLRLMAVVLVPFSTSLLNDYPDITLGAIWLPLNFAIITAITSYEWWYATTKRNYSEGLTREEINVANRRNLATILLSVVITVMTTVLHSYAMLLFFCVPLVMRIAEKGTSQEAGL
jgi:uncharacterized membrane protein